MVLKLTGFAHKGPRTKTEANLRVARVCRVFGEAMGGCMELGEGLSDANDSRMGVLRAVGDIRRLVKG